MLAPRRSNDVDSIRIHTIQNDWSDGNLLKSLKNLCVTGNWKTTSDNNNNDSTDVDMNV